MNVWEFLLGMGSEPAVIQRLMDTMQNAPDRPLLDNRKPGFKGLPHATRSPMPGPRRPNRAGPTPPQLA